MKKVLLFISLFFTSVLVTSAKPCKVISGDGTKIGDEIACGTEQFYVIENDGTTVKMLAKYNLLVGASYEIIEFENYSSENRNDYYTRKEVKEKLAQGYTVMFTDYSYNSTTKKYDFNNVTLVDEYLIDDKVVWFDSPLSERKDIINSKEAKKYFEDGYRLKNTIPGTDGYIGATFSKNETMTYKTIFLDGTSRSYIDLSKLPEVKTLLDDGYEIDTTYYTTKTGATIGNIYDFYAVTFAEYSNYDLETKFFETPIEKDDFDKFVAEDETLQSKINAGYSYSYYNDYYYNNTDKKYTNAYYGIYWYKENNYYKETHQSELAIGIHGEAGAPIYPFYGIVNDDLDFRDYVSDESRNIGEAYGGGNYQDISVEGYDYFEWYLTTLNNMGYPIKEVTMMSVTDLNNIITNVTGSPIPLEDWYVNKKYIPEAESYLLGSIKELLGEKHPWLYSTAYWLKTKPLDLNQSLFEVSTLGDLCANYICKSEPTTGVRPLVTISAEDIAFAITTKTDGNGKIKPSAETENSGNEVTFVVAPNEGYILSEVKVTDSNGNLVTFTDYTFTMPSADVIIEATFAPIVEDNPNTSDKIVLTCITILTLVLILIHNQKKKNSLN